MKSRHFSIPLHVAPNRWDGAAFLLVFGLLALIGQGAALMHVPLAGAPQEMISLDPAHLPEYALRTVLRLLAAMALALVFTFSFATLAHKSRRFGMILIPILDVLQSIPVLGFISFTAVFFLNLFPGNMLGAECAAIFAIFTSQAWNMTFSFYQSLRTTPCDLDDVCLAYRFSGWQRFWRLEVPFAMPGLVWNMMMSMSGGWFFVVASEAITVGHTTIILPGIGSYVALAIEQENLRAVGYAMAAMLAVILAYDQLLFRPLVVWSERFRMGSTAPLTSDAWVLRLLRRTELLKALLRPLSSFGRWSLRWRLPRFRVRLSEKPLARATDGLWYVLIGALVMGFGWKLLHYLYQAFTLADIGEALMLGAFTLLRVMILIALASLVWVPIGVWIGLRPRVAAALQPLAQFLAAFPANILFPPVVMLVVAFRLDPNIWLSPLMILGTQWYILFNVIAGASSLPTDLKFAAANFHVRGWAWWKKIMLPAVLPYYITGALTASGGAWNASIVAELIRWGDTTLAARGIGAYISSATAIGDFPRIVLGVAVMALYVILYNRLVWRRLYRYAEKRVRL